MVTFALASGEEIQGERIGTFMLRHLIQLGRADGIRTFVADVLVTNARMLRLLQKMAPKRRSTFADGVWHVEFDLVEAAPPLEHAFGDQEFKKPGDQGD